MLSERNFAEQLRCLGMGGILMGEYLKQVNICSMCVRVCDTLCADAGGGSVSGP